MVGTGMPEATAHINRHPGSYEDDVRPPSPVREERAMESVPETQSVKRAP